MKPGWDRNPIIVIIGVIASCIAIFTFFTGIDNIKKLSSRDADQPQVIYKPAENSNTATEIPTHIAAISPTSNTSSDLSSKLYILGYSSEDLAVRQAVANCSNCQVIYLSSLNELPEDWHHYSFNLASPTKNLPDGCKTKEELMTWGVTLMLANNYTPCAP